MNNLVVTQENVPAVATEVDYKKIAIEWLTSTGNLQKFTEQEKMQFCDICAAYGLNPIKREVYGIKYGTNFNLIVGYESYIKRAERSGRLDGWHVEVVGSGPSMKAVITINRKDWTKPFIHEVYFEEYNSNQNLWKTKPRTMLKKVAIAQGFRMCFSEELGGMPYTSEELSEIVPAEQSPNFKAETNTTISSDPTPKNLNKKSKPAPLYTKEQANTLAQVVNQNYNNGDPVFTAEEKDIFREMLMTGKYDDAFKTAQEMAEERFNKGEALDAVITEIADANAELEKAANDIF